MKISIIIPTYNRTDDLNECLNSILIQTILSHEIIIVDNSNNRDSEDLIKKRKDEFKKNDISLRYIKNNRENSLTVAKNIGIKCSTGNIISFLDDDSILDRRYYEEIIRVYREKPHALGVAGLVQKKEKIRIRSRFGGLFNKLFFIYSKEKSKCKIFPSLGVSYPLFAEGVVSCEWLSGVATYRRTIFEEFKFDENLKKYAWGEDQDISYRIFKKYPASLFMTPFAKYTNRVSHKGRMPSREQFYMEEIYPLYLFYKIIDQKVKNKVIYIWSRIGRLLFNILIAILRSKAKCKEIIYRIWAIIFCMKHIREIREGDLRFFNNMLKGNSNIKS